MNGSPPAASYPTHRSLTRPKSEVASATHPLPVTQEHATSFDTSSSTDSSPCSNDPEFGGVQNDTRIVMFESAGLNRSHLPVSMLGRVHVCDSWSAAVAFFADGNSGCLLIDFDANRQNHIEQMQRLSDDWQPVSVIACSRHNSASLGMAAAKAGCTEFVTLSSSNDPTEHFDDLQSAVGRACKSDTRGNESPHQFRANWQTLTDREKEVIRFFVSGLNSKVIAKELNLSYQTIDKHRNRGLKKMNCNSLVAFAQLL